MKCVLITLVGALLMTQVVRGDTYVWTGGGDGHSFSDSRNWGKERWTKTPFATGSWDIIILNVQTAGAVLTNDFDVCEVYTLRILEGSASFKLEGNKIDLLSNAGFATVFTRPRNTAIECLTTAPVEIACPLEAKPTSSSQTFNCVSGGNLTFSGPIINNSGVAVKIFGGDSQATPDVNSVFTLAGDNSAVASGFEFRGGVFHFGSAAAAGGKDTVATFFYGQKIYFDGEGTYEANMVLSDDEQRNFFFNADANLPRSFDLTKATKKGYQIGYVNANVTIGRFGSSSVPFSAAAFEVADGCRFAVNGAVQVVGDFATATGASGGQTKTGTVVLLGSSVNGWASYTIRYADLVCGASDVLASGGTVGWGNFLGGVSNCAVLDLNGFDQTIDRLREGPYSGYWSLIVNSGYLGERVRTPEDKPATLTMKASSDSTLQTDFQGPISLVWDPKGDYTLEIKNRTVTMTGDLEIKRGTFVLSGGTAMATMPNIRRCVLGPTAKLKVSAAQTFPIIEVNGEYPARDRYQPMDGTDATAKKVDWLASGSAVIEANTRSVWKSPVDGNWHDATKWSVGVPNESLAGSMVLPGVDHMVAITSDAGAIGHLELANAAGTVTLAVSNALSVPGTSSVRFGGGSRLLVGEGGSVNAKGPVELCKGATLVAEGGTLSFDVKDRAAGAHTESLVQNGGTLLATNDARLAFGGYFSKAFGTGVTRFSGSATLAGELFGATTVRLYSSPSDGEVSDVSFLERASIKGSSLDQFVIGYQDVKVSPTTTALFHADTEGILDFGAYLVVGSAYGRGEFDLLRGTAKVGHYGLDVGGYYLMSGRGSTDNDVTGVVRVRGGKLDISADYTTYQKNRVRGLILGSGWYNKKTESSSNWHRGRLELSGGSVTNTHGMVVLGAGCGEGQIVQTGGTFDSVGNEGVQFVLGWLGGRGEYILSNGVARVVRPVYVGGLPMENTPYTLDVDHPAGHDATGRLAVLGGSFKAESGIVVGADGSGAVVVGGAGALDISGGLVLTNGYVGASGSSDLEFRVDAAGAGNIRATGALTVADGSTLTVAVSCLPDDFKRTRLVSCVGMNGAFASGNVVIAGDAESVKDLCVRQSAAGISLVKQEGLCVIVR